MRISALLGQHLACLAIVIPIQPVGVTRQEIRLRLRLRLGGEVPAV